MLDGDDYFINPEYIADAVKLALQRLISSWSSADFSKAQTKRDQVSDTAPEFQPLMDGTEFFLQHPPFYDAMPYHMTCSSGAPPRFAVDFIATIFSVQI
jgi:hypothetical protein